MNIYTSNPVDTISLKLKSTLTTITSDVGTLPMALYEDMEKEGVAPAGPMLFIYRGVDGNPESVFDLEIAVPYTREVDPETKSEKPYAGKYDRNQLESYRYVETLHTGSLENLGTASYEPLFKELQQADIASSGFGCEVYQNFVSHDSDENETLVRVGVI